MILSSKHCSSLDTVTIREAGAKTFELPLINVHATTTTLTNDMVLTGNEEAPATIAANQDTGQTSAA